MDRINAKNVSGSKILSLTMKVVTERSSECIKHMNIAYVLDK